MRGHGCLIRGGLSFLVLGVLVLASAAPSLLALPFGSGLDNFDIAADEPVPRQQVEPSLTINPRNPRVLVAGAQDYRFGAAPPQGFRNRWNGHYRSVDGGRTWTSSLVPGHPLDTSEAGRASPLFGAVGTSDPVVAFGPDGHLYHSGIAIRPSPLRGAGTVTFVARYSEDGAHYDFTTIVSQPDATGAHQADKNWVTVDTSPHSPYRGRVYVVWAQFDRAEDALVIMFSASADQGRTFTPPRRISENLLANQFASVATGPVGEVYVVWQELPEQRGVPVTFYLARSLDGGATFTAPQPVHRVRPTPSPLPNNQFRTFTFPALAVDLGTGPTSGRLYLAWAEWDGDDADVYLITSSDAGATWTAPVRVDDYRDDAEAGAHQASHQFLPAVAAGGGQVHVVYYDTRLDASGCNCRLVDLQYSKSVNGGRSFLPSQRVTTSSFDPNRVPRVPVFSRPFLGDYIGVAVHEEVVYAIWTDNRNADLTRTDESGRLDQDVYVARLRTPRPPPLLEPLTAFERLTWSRVDRAPASARLGDIGFP